MNCKKDEASISGWLDGELADDVTREVEAHVAVCDACRTLSESLRSMGRALSRETHPDPGFLARFRRRREDLSVAPWWTWRQLALRLLPVAAAALLAASAVVWVSASEERDLEALEAQALGNPAVLDASSLSARESVLSIALEPFPAEVP